MNPSEMEFWLVRHGRTAANEEGRYQGRRDFCLCEAGRREAEALSRRLQEVPPFDLFLSSDLQRAWQTAEIISRGIKLTPLSEPLLREASWGFVEGLRRSEVEARYPFLFRFPGGPLAAHRCGGESERKLLARTRALRRKICRLYPGRRRILLVSHGRLINAFICGCLGFSSRQKWPYAPAPASISIVGYKPEKGRGRLLLFSDTAHL
ncbi:MAG: histidine phosphatase family protein [Firmicutes bacterium]|nr:histidine phosphatase family protein [Bacillota bacterium]